MVPCARPMSGKGQQVILAKSVTVNPDEQIAREYADRLILAKISSMQNVVKLSEVADQLKAEGLGLGAVRSLLASNSEKFAYAERRWVPAARVEGAGRPIAEMLRLIVTRFGGPMPLSLLMHEMAILAPQISEEQVERMLETSEALLVTDSEEVVARAWVFDAYDENVSDALARQKISQEELEAIQAKVKGTDWRTAEGIESALAKVAPVSVKAFGAVAWLELNSQNSTAYLHFNWKDFNRALFSIPGYVMSPNGYLHPVSDSKKWLSTAVKVADRLAPLVEIEDAAPIEVKQVDVDKMVKRFANDDTSVSAIQLLEEVYEITPSVKTFPDDLSNLMDALKARSEVVWVGGDRFARAGAVPEFVQTVPEIFEYHGTGFTDDEGEPVDVELSDEGLSSTLRKLLNHPLAMDVLDEDTMPLLKQQPESVRCVLKPIHRETGTFPLCQFSTGWFDQEPKHQEMLLRDSEGREIQVWANMEFRLMFGLIDWFYEQPIESGAVFSLTRTTKPNVFDFEWLDQQDPVVFITAQRMEELREIQSREAELSTFAILREIMAHWPKGADFLTILWELNVVRRTSRRMVASLLSSYSCFYQRSGSPVWHFDNKKVEQGFDKTKKKFVIKT